MDDLEQSQNQTQEDGASNPADGSEEAAINALMQRDEQQEQDSEKEGEREEGQDEKADDEKAETDEQSEVETEEVQIDGQTYEVPKAVAESILRQADYSRNMAAVKAERDRIAVQSQAVEAERERAQAMTEANEVLIAAQWEVSKAQALLEKVDRADVAGQVTAFRSLAEAQSQLAKVEQAVKAKQGEFDAKAQEAFNKARASMVDALEKSKDIKWSEQVGANLTQYMVNKGMTWAQVSRLTDPSVVIAWEKARQWDLLQAKAKAVTNKPKDAAKTARPGTSNVGRSQAPVQQAQSRFNKTRSDADALDFLEARENARTTRMR